ncbi:hypothetical protein HYS91_02860 [Candidatus Daviesbacteria bacterium]|nr:hypothetical protein [Candidatus Daviesbacteria bacterium]
MFNFRIQKGKENSKRLSKKIENPLTSQVRKVLSSGDQTLILMVRN